jgi:hypothetical protein
LSLGNGCPIGFNHPQQPVAWRNRTDLEAADVNDKREEAETPPDNLQRLAAALDAVERELAGLNAAQTSGKSGETVRIEETRDLLRRAIHALAPENPSLAVPADTGPGKRRVKIKAESGIATSSEAVGAAGAPSKSDASAAKPAAQVARARRRVAAAEKAARGSLIARLGAAAEAAESEGAPEHAPEDANEGGSTPVVPAGRAGTDKAISGTAERLAQLEAEIADLTERVTATPAGEDEPAERSWRPPDTAAGDRLTSAGLVGESDDDDDAEITIIGADGAPVEATDRNGRQSPRIFRENPPPLAEEEAEVEIRGSGVAAAGGRGADRPGTVRVSARTTAGVGGSGPRGKWRLFGGSS